MTHCGVDFEELSAFVDGELEEHRELEVRRHLDLCARCTERVEGLSRLKVKVGRNEVSEPVPPALARHLRRYAPSSRRRARSLAAALVLLTTALLAGSVLWHGRSVKSSRPFMTALVADHIHFQQGEDRAQVVASDPEALSRWFATRLPFRPEFSTLAGAEILGGRLCTIRKSRLALVFLRRGGERLSFFVGDEHTLTPDAIRAWPSVPGRMRCQDVMQGYRVCLQREGKVLTALVGPSRLLPRG